MTDKITPERRAHIEKAARIAARDRVPLRDCCPYPFGTPEAIHFAAVYALALPKEPRK